MKNIPMQITRRFFAEIVRDPEYEYGACAAVKRGRLRLFRVSSVHAHEWNILSSIRIGIFLVQYARDTVWFIHNHPSGNLNRSGEDLAVESVIREALDRFLPGVRLISIVCTTTGFVQYGEASGFWAGLAGYVMRGARRLRFRVGRAVGKVLHPLWKRPGTAPGPHAGPAPAPARGVERDGQL